MSLSLIRLWIEKKRHKVTEDRGGASALQGGQACLLAASAHKSLNSAKTLRPLPRKFPGSSWISAAEAPRM